MDQLGYQMLKYQQRDGWSHRDVLRLVHAEFADPAQARTVGAWIAASGLDWLKMPKLGYLVGHWEKALAQALEWDAQRKPTRAEPKPLLGKDLAKKAEAPPDEALAELKRRFGFNLPASKGPA